jgi:hypothetical protein
MTYQVPMHEVAVVVALSGVEPEEHFVYLAPYSDRRDGPETMADYLNGRRCFFPMVAAGVAKMVNRDQILWLRYEKLAELDPDATLIERVTIVEMTDGTRLEGTIPIDDRPREQSRISDVLNDGNERFIRLDDEEETYYINKKFIRLVIPR